MRVLLILLSAFVLQVLGSRHPRVGAKQKRYAGSVNTQVDRRDASVPEMESRDLVVTPKFFIISLVRFCGHGCALSQAQY